MTKTLIFALGLGVVFVAVYSVGFFIGYKREGKKIEKELSKNE